jgi:hypothetical protein
LNIDTTADNGTGNPIITPTVYPLTVARNPSIGGDVAVTVGGVTQNNPNGQTNHNANTSITVAATANSNYTFKNWTGSLPSGVNANSASITFNITGNVNITANFEPAGIIGPQLKTYTLQVSRNVDYRGDVSVKVGSGNPQNNPTNSISIDSGTSVTVTATPQGGRTFEKWTGSLPAGAVETNPTITFDISANVNITANFQSISGGGTSYTLNVGKNIEDAGNVTVNGIPSAPGQPTTVTGGESVTLTATANSGYAFREWTGSLPSGVDKNSATVTFSVNADVSIVANFRENTGGGNRTDTLKIEAEWLTSSNPQIANCPANPPGNQSMCISSPNSSTGVVNIGYISNNNSATYEVNIARNGQYTMVFRIASNGQATFRVTVNNVPMGTVSGNTQNWDGYVDAPLSYPDVPLNEGQNIIRLDFQSAVNVDYFLILGEAQTSSVWYSAPNRTAAPRTAVALKASPKGFTALLPTNHGYTSYRLIDLKGREVRSGKVGPGVTELRFDGLRRSVLFLKLDGAKGNKPLVLKAVTY